MRKENQGGSISGPLTFEAPPKCLRHACHPLLHYSLHTHDDDDDNNDDGSICHPLYTNTTTQRHKYKHGNAITQINIGVNKHTSHKPSTPYPTPTPYPRRPGWA